MSTSDIVGLVLAGGRSQRFGADKAAAMLGGKTLLERVEAVLAPACRIVAVSANVGSAAQRMVLPDPPGAPDGPLAGVLAGLQWARREGAAWLATAPCDTPLLPADLVDRLIAGAGTADLAFAATADGPHPLCAVWRPALADSLAPTLAAGHPPTHGFAAEVGGVAVRFATATAFLNINTPDDLARAAKILGG